MTDRDPRVVSTVDLPSGKVLEIVQPTVGAPYARVQAETGEERDLSRCGACDSNLVEPSDWESAGEGLWRVTLRCPECEQRTEGVFSQTCVDRFDEQLDEGLTAIVSDLKQFEHANMVADAERFIGALNAGAILPEDFDDGGQGITGA